LVVAGKLRRIARASMTFRAPIALLESPPLPTIAL
jgi:hypothetical protein